MVEQKKPPLTHSQKASGGPGGRVVSSLGPAATLPSSKIPQWRWRMEGKEKPPATCTRSCWGKHRTEKAPCPRDTLPQVKLKMEEPPLTRPLASRGPVVALSPTREVPMHYHLVRYHNGGGGWKEKRTGVNGPQNNDRHKQICGHQRCRKRRDIVPWYTTTRTCL